MQPSPLLPPSTHDALHTSHPAGWADVCERALWARLRDSGDEAIRQHLIHLHLDYARTVAATYYARRHHNEIEFAEYLQIASLALVESVDRYDPDRGAQFKTFAARRMHGAILDGLEHLTEKQQQIAMRQRLRQERLQSIKEQATPPAARPSASTEKTAKAHADELFAYLAEVGIGLALSCLLDDTGMLRAEGDLRAAPDQMYQRAEFRQLQRRVRELVDHLPPQERSVVSLHYLQEHGFDEIAGRLGLTKGRISQIHRSALQSLRAQLRSSKRCDLSC